MIPLIYIKSKGNGEQTSEGRGREEDVPHLKIGIFFFETRIQVTKADYTKSVTLFKIGH